MGMQEPSLRGTAVCSYWPTASLEDYQSASTRYRTTHGIEKDGSDAYIVGLYYAD